jgi:hypothetical protein
MVSDHYAAWRHALAGNRLDCGEEERAANARDVTPSSHEPPPPPPPPAIDHRNDPQAPTQESPRDASLVKTAKAIAAQGSERFHAYISGLAAPTFARIKPYLDELQSIADAASAPTVEEPVADDETVALFDEAADGVRDEAGLNEVYDDIVEPVKMKLSSGDMARVDEKYRRVLERVRPR